MTVNEVIYILLREALFGQRAEGEEKDALAKETSYELWNRVYTEMKMHAIIGITAPAIVRHEEIPENLRRNWAGLQKNTAIKYVQMATGQKETCRLLQDAGIHVAVMKGTAAAIYYPVPEYRIMGDIDLLVKPEEFERAIALLIKNGYEPKRDEEGQYHTALTRYGILYEVHKSPGGTHISEKGNEITKYILSGLDHIETNTLGHDQFPILPWKQNGMELIWHIRQHLYNGLGLRQIIDWMMFVNHILDDTSMEDFFPDLKACGLDHLAAVVTKMCQKYLGLQKDNITWCRDVDESLCDELMKFIMEQGDFGLKATDEKTAKVISGYSNPKVLFRKLQDIGESEWKLLKKCSGLTPIAFLYGVFFSIRTLLNQKRGWKKNLDDFRVGRRRQRMFSRLYGKVTEHKKEMKFETTIKKALACILKGTIESRKNKIRILIKWINQSRISAIFKVVADIVAIGEYYVYDFILLCKGYRMPLAKDREYVRENVTFIYKSFERQKMARDLYKSIQRFYPGTQVIIADDSKNPLRIAGKYVSIIDLPFNSGLSYGLNQAIKRVKTPYVIRLDDDHLLTRRTLVEKQLTFLQNHSEVDLVGFGLINALRLETPEEHIHKFYSQSMSYAPKPLKLPHLTRIDDTHIVLGKGLNLFIVKTETLKQIGYDDNIRMIDHDDFFYRAAGNIVSVVAEDTRVFHRHNPFDSGYLRFRNDVERDIRYIRSARAFRE